jgi:hypothetical protein
MVTASGWWAYENLLSPTPADSFASFSSNVQAGKKLSLVAGNETKQKILRITLKAQSQTEHTPGCSVVFQNSFQTCSVRTSQAKTEGFQWSRHHLSFVKNINI